MNQAISFALVVLLELAASTPTAAVDTTPPADITPQPADSAPPTSTSPPTNSPVTQSPKCNETNNITDYKFDDLWAKYPDPKTINQSDIWKKAGFDENYGNTCALRFSYTLYQLGYKICITNKDNCNWSGFKNKQGQKYIIRADTWHCYLTKIFKQPLCVKDKAKLAGKKGIITFRHCSWKEDPAHPTGHIDLWDGEKCRNQCYFQKCTEYCLFEVLK